MPFLTRKKFKLSIKQINSLILNIHGLRLRMHKSLDLSDELEDLYWDQPEVYEPFYRTMKGLSFNSREASVTALLDNYVSDLNFRREAVTSAYERILERFLTALIIGDTAYVVWNFIVT